VRIASTLLLIACLAGCKSGRQNNDAVRQGVIDYLQKAGMNVAGMDVNIANVKFNGSQADATVNMGVKGSGKALMTMNYHLEEKDNKWVVVGKQDSGQHATMPGAGAAGAAGAAGGAENPHGAGAPGAGGADPHGGKMPAPEDLPPAGKKK
jgi:hypothetical protein